jgi:hypothetical protein
MNEPGSIRPNARVKCFRCDAKLRPLVLFLSLSQPW